MIKYDKHAEPRRPNPYWLPPGWFLGCLLLAGLCLGLKSFGNQNPSETPSVPAKTKHAVTKPIAQIRVGEWVVAENPALKDSEGKSLVAGERVRAEDWRKISLRMTKQDGDLLRMEFLRPAAWLESHHIRAGGKITMLLGEMHADGLAAVLSVDSSVAGGTTPLISTPGRVGAAASGISGSVNSGSLNLSVDGPTISG